MIIFEKVSKKFENKAIFENVSFEIEKGESVAIIGKSGTGKTTVGRIIAGLETPSDGNVLIKNMVLNAENLREIRKIVGFVFQDFKLFPHMTVLENIAYSPLYVYKQTRAEVLRNATEALARLNLVNCENKYPSQLSGGQKQRVAIIRAIMINPEILIFDEPTASLDFENKDEVAALIKELQSNLNLTSVTITHDLDFAKKVSNKTILLQQNSVLMSNN